MKPKVSTDPRRSALMSRVRQKGTAVELKVGAALRECGAAYRVNVRGLPGSPDFANRTRRWAVFVHGCFWHHHTACKRATVPKSNEGFWRAKFVANRVRDANSIRELRRGGFRVAIVWECEADSPERLARKLSQVLEPRGVCVRQPIDH
jgi:DNA mismatch endonuclease (patch repair protein)